VLAVDVLLVLSVVPGTPFARQAPTPAASTGAGSGVGIGKEAEWRTPDTGWRDLSMADGWIATGDGARYRVRDGICYLQVHFRRLNGTWPDNAWVTTLPASARPAWNHVFIATHAGLPFGEVGVYDDGGVLMVPPSEGGVGNLAFSASFPVGR
jgi:hypothetical protein